MMVYTPRNIETEPLKREILVHGAMNYKCIDCGRVFKMWLEKGLEDKRQNEIEPDKHKPVPFSIGCLCGGMAEHVYWHKDIDLGGYRPLGDNMSYFENVVDTHCGISHIRTDGNDQSFSSEDFRKLFSQIQKEEDEYIERAKRAKCSHLGLESYSTTQLKAELRRRKKWY